MFPDCQMLWTFLFTNTALFAISKGLSLMLDVIFHHVLRMVFQAIYIIIGIHFKNPRNIDSNRAGLAVFTALPGWNRYPADF